MREAAAGTPQPRRRPAQLAAAGPLQCPPARRPRCRGDGAVLPAWAALPAEVGGGRLGMAAALPAEVGGGRLGMAAALPAEVGGGRVGMAAAAKVEAAAAAAEERVRVWAAAQVASGRRVALVTSGGTQVPLETRAVRFLENFSSGRRGAVSAE